MDPLGDGRGCSTDSWDWAKMAPVKSEELSKGNIFSVKKISKERERTGGVFSKGRQLGMTGLN